MKRRGGPQIFKATRHKHHRSQKNAEPGKDHSVAEPETLQLLIEGLSEQGAGVARHKDRPVFIAGALPGEQVEVKIQGRFRRHDEAELVSVIEASPDRAQPSCEYFGRCGGCQLQHLAEPKQAKIKHEQLQRRVRAAGFDGELEVIESPFFAYRHRARLAYSRGKFGFRAANAKDVVAIEQCPLLSDPLNQTIQQLKSLISENVPDTVSLECLLSESVATFSPITETPVGVLFRVQSFGKKGSRPDKRWVARLSSELPENLCLFDIEDDAGKSELSEYQESAGDSALQYQLTENLALAFTPADFTQVNPLVNHAMIATVCEWLNPEAGETIADFFCGLGNFSLPIAAKGAAVRSFDLGADMIARAVKQADFYELAIDYLCCDLFDAKQTPSLRGISKAVLDPPRAGAKQLCEEIAQSRDLQKLVYVSCSPASLQRDLEILSRGGFKIKAVKAADMFPQTHHQEAMVLLSRD
ncbi:23S rRNA (uracil(1939)-C(5))-methyltransferase RlmD [Spongiibacter sp. KMU-158]|uniref:23S rRNA (Uracil(1939)-C(5))-methyltransferase RlmD n=1 Tax=Spongiibacter pelagi TaxID=2760804 RepID=A0A927C4T4_9GAMM|nr:23S rRNA (uracil(1939)-C(5))-methyltransferase RlmD [Spongiibacter pelagi]MBD2859902.1 23S rRNA (uracil(1939)-C(5))-methyltransferase RlmD [Spongiibacter pelagi]